MTPPVVSITDVSFAYNRNPVLEHINLTVGQGEFLAVLGPNGGGKTTLLKILLGLLEPDIGTVRVFGHPPTIVRGRIGYVPQHVVMQPSFPISVLEVTLMGLQSSRRPGFGYNKKDRQLAMTALERVGMKEMATQRMDSLSGGQRQRALVARALVGEPDLLVFDEPTANIDPQGKLCLYELLASLEQGITIILVSHDPVVASVSVTSVAAVNKTLITSHTDKLTPEMLALVYGDHKHTCPIDDLLHDSNTILTPIRGQ